MIRSQTPLFLCFLLHTLTTMHKCILKEIIHCKKKLPIITKTFCINITIDKTNERKNQGSLLVWELNLFSQ